MHIVCTVPVVQLSNLGNDSVVLSDQYPSIPQFSVFLFWSYSPAYYMFGIQYLGIIHIRSDTRCNVITAEYVQCGWHKWDYCLFLISLEWCISYTPVVLLSIEIEYEAHIEEKLDSTIITWDETYHLCWHGVPDIALTGDVESQGFLQAPDGFIFLLAVLGSTRTIQGRTYQAWIYPQIYWLPACPSVTSLVSTSLVQPCCSSLSLIPGPCGMPFLEWPFWFRPVI